MKKLFTSILLLTIALSSCSESEERTEGSMETSSEDEVENSDVTPETNDTEPVEEEIQSKYAYDQDWEMIKEAIINQDISGLGAWAGNDAFDAELFIEMAQEDWVLDALKNTSYDDLEVEEMDSGVFLVFYADITGVDAEGDEYGSSMTLYMSQGDPNLMVEYFIAAG
ncbi:hypothetical protein [Parvicella tangerina]|uniref:Uncharacterized protein n=1 Tax=Parvicella tangerina TaxID=2829795 RepID=A0A916JIU1_9FLAO|nr:hypothetical protein [Parvicella tangerina]CAG5076274.1 hypothetical protein CRYO30217_00029 [Parvicella tangerina]